MWSSQSIWMELLWRDPSPEKMNFFSNSNNCSLSRPGNSLLRKPKGISGSPSFLCRFSYSCLKINVLQESLLQHPGFQMHWSKCPFPNSSSYWGSKGHTWPTSEISRVSVWGPQHQPCFPLPSLLCGYAHLTVSILCYSAKPKWFLFSLLWFPRKTPAQTS